MAIRSEELIGRDAVVYRFPTAAVRSRAARQRVVRARRRLLAIVASVLVTGLFLMTGSGPGTAVASRADAPRTIVLAPGDTLWQVAERYAPAAIDPRAYVDALVELNDLQGAVPAGARLRLP